MLWTLLAKDLQRARSNPVPWLIAFAFPLFLTAITSFAFGGRDHSGPMGRIQLAVVVEDGALRQEDFQRFTSSLGIATHNIDMVFTNRESAEQQITDQKLIAAIVVPTNFVHSYVVGGSPTSLELIKNPVRSAQLMMMEELFAGVVATLNAAALDFRSETERSKAIPGNGNDFDSMVESIERFRQKLNLADGYRGLPFVSYQKTETGVTANPALLNPLAYLLLGFVSMFLFFIAGNGTADLLRELRLHTFERYYTLNEPLLPFVAGKMIFAMVLLMVSSAVALVGGAVVFHIVWHRPFILAALVLSYTFFLASLASLLVALVPDERNASALTGILGMTLGLIGGCTVPVQQLPAFLRDHITPLLPTFWFVDAARNIEFGQVNSAWMWVFMKSVGIGILMMGTAAFVFQQRFRARLH